MRRDQLDAALLAQALIQGVAPRDHLNLALAGPSETPCATGHYPSVRTPARPSAVPATAWEIDMTYAGTVTMRAKELDRLEVLGRVVER